jgi:hypothetical protein
MASMTDDLKTIACGCTVTTYRDFLGRVLGTVQTQAAECRRPEHAPGQVIIMPGREHARPE